MIVGSVLLILVAIVLLGLGLTGDSNGLLYGSIATSLLAAVTLYIGARQAVASRAAGERVDTLPVRGDEEPESDPEVPEPALVTPRAPERLTERIPVGPPERESRFAGTATVTATGKGDPVTTTIPAQPTLAAGDGDPVDEYDEDPPDEPAPQDVSAADAARIATMSGEVLVIDGRPRYHQLGCIHLLGRDSEPLPVSEAVELGFTPCGRCEPDSALLAEARRV